MAPDAWSSALAHIKHQTREGMMARDLYMAQTPKSSFPKYQNHRQVLCKTPLRFWLLTKPRRYLTQPSASGSSYIFLRGVRDLQPQFDKYSEDASFSSILMPCTYLLRVEVHPGGINQHRTLLRAGTEARKEKNTRQPAPEKWRKGI